MDGLLQLWVTMEILLGRVISHMREIPSVVVRSRLEITTWPSDLNPSNDNYCCSSNLTINLLLLVCCFLSNLIINLLPWCVAFLSNLTVNLLSWCVAVHQTELLIYFPGGLLFIELNFYLPSWWAALFYLAALPYFCSQLKTEIGWQLLHIIIYSSIIQLL